MAEGLRLYALTGSAARWADEVPRIAAMGFNAVLLPTEDAAAVAASRKARLVPLLVLSVRGDPDRDLVGPATMIAYFAEAIRRALAQGFGGFCCHSAHRVSLPIWRTLIAVGRNAAPDCLFCAETLGAPVDQSAALAGAGFDYFFNSLRWWDFHSPWLLDQYEALRHVAPTIGFPDSADTPRLAAELAAAGVTTPEAIAAEYRQRYAIAACFSSGVMMPAGFEAVGSADLSPFIAAVNEMKRAIPALNEEGPQRLLNAPGDPLLLLARATETGDDWAFIALNRDAAPRTVSTDLLLAGIKDHNLLLEEVTPGKAPEAVTSLRLAIEPFGLRILRARTVAAPERKEALARNAMSPGWSPAARIIIEAVVPELDGGRFPVKRLVGDELEVGADIFRDGHDVIGAAILYRPEHDDAWQEAPLRVIDNDRWGGSVRLTTVGRTCYTVEAWTDQFASWRADTLKKQTAGQPIALELGEGQALVAAALERAGGSDERLLCRFLAEIDEGDEAQRSELLLSHLLAHTMTRWPDRAAATRYGRILDVTVDRERAEFAAWYELMPRSQGKLPGQSATFDDCIARLPEIRAMGFDVVYLPPIHPIGRINRKGRDNSLTALPGDPGSPYAIGGPEGGHCGVHPELGGIAGFRRFVAAARGHGMDVALDFAVQAAPDHPWVTEHPEWFQFRADGTIKYAENPPKKYQDIVNIDLMCCDREAVWQALRDVVLFWIGEGVTIFRVDNPHTKPVPFWEWLIREVQHRHPGTIFLAEAFTRPKMMRVLAKAGFTQSYSYFTWRNEKQELIDYLLELTAGPSKDYLRPNFFANTPDILPVFLQQGGRAAFLIRLVLAATLSSVYGIYNGFELCEGTPVPNSEEYLHSEKYEWKVWDWDRPGHIKDEITRVNLIRRENPALHRFGGLRFWAATSDQVLLYSKITDDGSNCLLIAVNLDPFAAHDCTIELPFAALDLADDATMTAEELLTGAEQQWRGRWQPLRLDPNVNPAALFRIRRPA